MPTFKRLTCVGDEGETIDVNMDTVINMQWFKDHTLIHFNAPSNESVLAVKETPDQIHMKAPLQSM